MRAWLFVCFIICCEMNIDRYIELEQEVKSIIGGAFVKAFNKSSTDFVLLMARGGYHKHLDRPDNDLTPFVLEDRGDFLMDLTRKKFFVRYLNNYVDRLKSGNMVSGDDMEYEVTTQLMIYSHIWESHLFLNQLARLAGIQRGIPYLWKTKLKQDGKKNFINRHIIDVFKKTDEAITYLIKKCYSDVLRNAFAHSTYYIYGGMLQPNHDMIFDGPSISFEQWEEIFVRAVLFSYHLNDMLLEERNHFIEINGDGPIVINMPMKNNHKELRGVYIKPEPFEGKEEKVKFRYMQIGEII